MKKLLGLMLLIGSLLSNAYAADDMQIYHAIEIDDVSTIKSAIESGSHHVNSKLAIPPYKAVPMIVLAGREASLRVLEFFISNKADVNVLNELTETALMLAAFFPDSGDSNSEDQSYDRHFQAVKMLVEAGATLENVPGAFTPLSYAAYAKHVNIARFLLEKGADSNGGADGSSSPVNTPLIMGALTGDPETVKLLLAYGANPRVLNGHGRDALYYAQKNGHDAVVQVLRCALNLKAGEKFSDVCR